MREDPESNFGAAANTDLLRPTDEENRDVNSLTGGRQNPEANQFRIPRGEE
jgi:hypothetical protein